MNRNKGFGRAAGAICLLWVVLITSISWELALHAEASLSGALLSGEAVAVKSSLPGYNETGETDYTAAGNLAAGRMTYVSTQHNSNLSGTKITNGSVLKDGSNYNRWVPLGYGNISVDSPASRQKWEYAVVDLGSVRDIEQVEVFFADVSTAYRIWLWDGGDARNPDRTAFSGAINKSYFDQFIPVNKTVTPAEIEAGKTFDGAGFTLISQYEATAVDVTPTAKRDVAVLDAPIAARYVIYEQLATNSTRDNNAYGGAIREIAAYEASAAPELTVKTALPAYVAADYEDIADLARATMGASAFASANLPTAVAAAVPANVVNGIVSTDNSDRWTPGQHNTDKRSSPLEWRWLVVDLADLETVERVDLYFTEVPGAYNVYLWDGKDRTGQTVAAVNAAYLDSFAPDSPNAGFTSADAPFVDAPFTLISAYDVGTLPGSAAKTRVDHIDVADVLGSAQSARYIVVEHLKYIQTQTATRSYSGSVSEIAVYSDDPGELDPDQLPPPGLPAGNNGSVILPGSRTSLYGSDNQQVIALDGTFYRPLVDMNMNVMYQVALNNETRRGTTDIAFLVPGRYADKGANAAPDVLPALREWYGGTVSGAQFTIDDSVIFTAAGNDAIAAATETMDFFADMLDVTATIGADGAVEFVQDAGLMAELGEEGYYLSINPDKITITAATKVALLYGGITVTQIFYGSDDRRCAPAGEARDYPRYPIRAGMIDVGRTYFPLDYLEEVGRYMAWYKLNELHVHLNDYWGGTGYKGFRLESSVFPELNQKMTGMAAAAYPPIASNGNPPVYSGTWGPGEDEGVYTKEDYRQFQLDLLNYGIEVINEIGVPYHAESFRDISVTNPLKPVMRPNLGYMDTSTPANRAKAVGAVMALINEYTQGQEPVFVSNKIHIGGDEYHDMNQLAAFERDLVAAIDTMGTSGRELEIRMWTETAVYNSAGLSDERARNITVNLWAPYRANVQSVYDKGYDVINTAGGWLYLVPRGNAGYPDRWNTGRATSDGSYYDYSNMYDNFEVNNFKPHRQTSNGTAIMPKAHPQTKGASFALWNDLTASNGGFSEFDLFDRLKDAIAFVAEKTWYGEKTAGQTHQNFTARVRKLWNYTPIANPGRYVESSTNVVGDYDFTVGLQDRSGNGYDAIAPGTVTGFDGLRLPAGTGLALPFEAIGYPYTVNMKVKLSTVPADTVLLTGEEGVLYANYKGSGHIGYKRGEKGLGYEFEFQAGNNHVKAGEWVDITLVADQKNTALYLGGTLIAARPVNTWINNGKRFIVSTSSNWDSTSFILPVTSILPDGDATVSHIKIYNKALTAAEVYSKG